MAKYATTEHTVKCNQCLITFALHREGLPIDIHESGNVLDIKAYECPNCKLSYWNPIFSSIDNPEWTQYTVDTPKDATFQVRNEPIIRLNDPEWTNG